MLHSVQAARMSTAVRMTCLINMIGGGLHA